MGKFTYIWFIAASNTWSLIKNFQYWNKWENVNCFQEDQATLCQPSCILREYTQIKYGLLEVVDFDFSDLWLLGIFFLHLKVISIRYENPSKHICSDSSLWHRQETLNCFCVNKATVMNSHSNWLGKNFYGLLLWLRGSGTWSPRYVCDWWTQITIFPKLSVCHLQKHNHEVE